MNISSMMGKQVAELQHTLSMNLLSSQMSTQTAQATVMLEDFRENQAASHPYKGQSLDIKG
ncbi:polyribonucleotide nucleotidyltransferase [Bacillus seohaeanensis]|jgi:hypothetical protein|uniref:Polyribonucleotide nucleotidyltransferase n=1 Tax=Bacillus seohaeanensis TaxID=284580 RepID=A0ABW5RTM2_9BACI